VGQIEKAFAGRMLCMPAWSNELFWRKFLSSFIISLDVILVHSIFLYYEFFLLHQLITSGVLKIFLLVTPDILELRKYSQKHLFLTPK